MSYTRAQWAAAFLQAVGNPNPDSRVLAWVVGWTRFETGGPPGAAYNLLNTEQTAPGSSNFNSVGVQNFISFAQGTQTNAKVLANGYYPTLLQALKTNNIAALGIGGSPSNQVNAQLSTWGTGPKAAQIAASGNTGMNDQFPGSTGGATTPVTVISAKSNTYPRGQCTWWANERFHQLTGYYVPWSGNANAWAAQAKKYQGWNVSGVPTTGAIMCLQAGVQLADLTYGHVGVVESVNGDGSFVASNSNWAGHVYPDTVKVTFHQGQGVSFITAGSSGNSLVDQGALLSLAGTGSNGLGGDVAGLFQAIGALFGSGSPPAPVETIFQQVHTTLVDNPGFYGIALAVDEAEQFPGWVNVATGPFDVIGIIRSSGASITDNFVPFWIRAMLVSLGMTIIVLLIAKVALGASESALGNVGQLLPLLGGI